MGILDSSHITTDGRKVTHVRVDRIGNAGDSELWWVALAFDDGSTKPSGMFTGLESARELGERLAGEWGVEIVETRVV